MAIRFNCEKCGKQLKANAEQAGARFKCTDCGAEGRVPKWQSEVRKNIASRADASAFFEQDAPEEQGEPPVSFERKFQSEDDLDMTPMVDVTFLLLIFFMITAAFSLQKSMEVPAPTARTAPLKAARWKKSRKTTIT